ncbi:hypothetical protein PIB30_105998 [Stylosanthes scabra]|uniref:Uncharacterized protein n=1 Tax=Stylosanthes scabra TaxID=79078 RepID=A0ABU6TYB8_9FABA|nr:hypothetical protein [Stylosanthes scabra]
MNQHPGDVPPFMQGASAPPTNQHPFGVPPFMFAVDFATMNGLEFAERENMDTCRAGYAGHDRGVIRRYNGRHTCAIGAISQDHSKLDSDTIAESIRPLIESDPSIKVRTIIAEVQSGFNYLHLDPVKQTVPPQLRLRGLVEFNERLDQRGGCKPLADPELNQHLSTNQLMSERGPGAGMLGVLGVRNQ